MSVADSISGKGQYLAVFQDKIETSGNRFKETEGIRGFAHPAEEWFRRGRCGGLPLVECVLFCGVRLALVGTKSLLNMTGDSRVVYDT